MTDNKKCPTCGENTHDFKTEKAFFCVPPKNTLQFGAYIIDNEYREALYKQFPLYTSLEIIGSFIGQNPSFPGQEEWLNPED